MPAPELFAQAQAVIEDFDGTAALTFEKSPNDIGVHEACEITVETMFGVNGLQSYIDAGGLKNRAPVQVVQELAPDADENELSELTEIFTQTKLDVLMGDIGTRFPDGSLWPRPTSGYLDFCESLETARQQGAVIDDIILSSGHEPFIKKTYAAWGVQLPTHIVAVETIARLNLGLPVDHLVKPSPVLMGIAHSMWRQGYGLDQELPIPAEELSRMIYVGDDPVKDGELAANSGVDFMLVEPTNATWVWRTIASRLGLAEFNENEARFNVK